MVLGQSRRGIARPASHRQRERRRDTKGVEGPHLTDRETMDAMPEAYRRRAAPALTRKSSDCQVDPTRVWLAVEERRGRRSMCTCARTSVHKF